MSKVMKVIDKPSDVLVYVTVDGSACELAEAEKKYVDSEFWRSGGARPCIKSQYEQRNARGELCGFLKRTDVPRRVPINPAPPSYVRAPPRNSPQSSLGNKLWI